MKKILALILTIASMASMLVMPVSAEETTPSLTQDQTALLSYIGVYDESQDLSKTITKAEFAGLLAKFAFGVDADIELYATGKRAADVKEGHAYFNEITALLSSGYVSTNKFGSFLPDTNLNINTAYEFILRTMGYSETDTFKEGKYARLAAQKDLSDGLAGADGELTFQNAYILIYNMLHTDVADMMSLVYNHISSNKELLYMQSRLGLYKIKGIVTDDGLFSLYGESAIKKGYISIDGKEAMLNGTAVADLVGKNVAGFYKKADGEEYELVCVYELTDKNSVISLNSANIVRPYTNNTYEYYEDEFSTKLKKAKVKTDATIIYNNKALKLTDTFTQDDFIPDNGFVKLYDNNGDGIMDIIRIEDYEEAVATAFDNTGDIYLCMKHTNEVINLSEITYTVFDAEGKEVPYNKIKPGNILSITRSFDRETYKMIISDKTHTATVKSVTKSTPSQRGYLLTEEGGKYSFSAWLEKHYGTPELGSTYKFSFDAFGRIVDIEKVSGSYDWLAGFVLWVAPIADMGGDIYIKMYNDAGIWEVLKPAEKVQVLGQDNSVMSYSPSELVTNFTYQGLIRYKMNKAGEVNKIELPLYFGTKPNTPDRLFCMLDTITEAPNPPIEGDTRQYAAKADYYLYKSGNSAIFGNLAYADTEAKVFITPTDDKLSTNLKDYEMGSTALFTAGTKTPVRVYGTDFRGFKASYVTTNIKASANELERGPLWIMNVRQTADPNTGEVVYQVETLNRSNVKAKYYIEKDFYETGIFGITAGNTSPIHLSAGDGAYAVTYKGYIVKATVMFDADQEATDSHGSKVVGMTPGIYTTDYLPSNTLSNPFGAASYNPQNSGNPNGWRYNPGQAKIFVGWVYSLDNGFITITNQNPASGPIDTTKTVAEGAVWETMYNPSASYMIKRPEMGRVKNSVTFEKGAIKDIKPYTQYGENCTRIILVKASYDPDTYVLINKE